MMIRRLLPTQLLLCGAAVALSALAVPPAYPQGKAPIDEPGIRLDAKDFTQSMEKAFKELIKKNDPPLEGKNAAAIDAAAKWYTYRVTWTEVQSEADKKWPTMSAVVNGFEDVLTKDFPKAAKNGAKNEKVRQKFLERSTERLKEVMANPRLIARVNGARMLAVIAENGYEDVADVLLEVVKNDKAGDGAKYWAYYGLKELFAHANRTGAELKNKAREADCILALLQAVERKGPMDGPREEVEGARVLRREAVRALAQVRKPVLADAKGKDVKARPALGLLRLTAQPDSYQPSLRLDEQVEAAVGLARVQTKGVPDYQADYAAEHLGKFAVRLAEEYQRAQETKTEKMEPWKVHASRLAEGLAQLKADTAKNAKDRRQIIAYVNDVADRTAADVLQPMEKGLTTRAGNLGNWLSSNPAKNQTLFRGLPDTAIKAGGPGETPPAAKPAEKPADKPGEPKKDK